jgi:hypothetical protein
MSDIQGAGEDALPSVETVPSSDNTPLSARDAARALSQYRWKRDANEERPAKPPQVLKPAEVIGEQSEESPAIQEIAAPEETPDTGAEQTAEAEQQEAPAPLELPRSWSKDETEHWNKLDPHTQEVLLEKDSQWSRDIRRAQNEAADSRKSVDAERAALEQARQQTEQLNTQLLERTTQSFMGEFSDIRSQADVERMAREDWPRFSLYQAKMMELQSYQRSQQEAQTRNQQEYRTKWDKFAKDEDAHFLEKAPEMQDEARATSVRNRSLTLLKDIGFSDEDLSKLWNGDLSLSLRDHRAQLLIRDAVRYREAQSIARTKTVKPVPTVQRPGSPAARAPEADIRIRQLEQQFDKTASWKNAAELLIAQRATRR